MSNGNGHSVMWSRLESVERAYLDLQAERDAARAERDAAREALKPLLEQVRALEAAILAQMPGEPKKVEGRFRKADPPSPEQVANWAARHAQGESLGRIAASSKVGFERVRYALEQAGVVVKVNPPKRGAIAHCRECGLPANSPALKDPSLPAWKDGECGLCQDIASDLAARRAEKAKRVDATLDANR